MAALPTNRDAAEANLVDALAQLGSLPSGTVRTDEMAAKAAMAQALATMATAQALLEIGDVLRAAFPAATTDGDDG